MIERLLYELREVPDESVVVEVQSARGTITWEQTIPVDRLVHEERLPADCDPEKLDLMVRFGDRLGRVARSAAWGRFVDYLSRMALNAGLEWLLLNLESDDYAFLFSTRMQEELAEGLGYEAGTLHTQEQRFYILTDRRIPAGTCYCIKTGNYRLFVRYEFAASSMRVYLSDMVRVGSRASVAQIDAAKAVQFLRTIRRTHMEPAQLLRTSEESGTSVIAAGTRPWNAPSGLCRDSTPGRLRQSRPEAAEALVEAGPQMADQADDIDEADLKSAWADPAPVPTVCPTCGGDLFALSETELICLSCDWNNLDRVR